ncbi:MAG: hypothetical protein M3R50_07720 [Bacteroidota bacterium]|nr:hypothetical protein [Bacteroidota bacterium]
MRLTAGVFYFNEADWGGKSGEDDDALFTHTGPFVELVKAISIKNLQAKTLAYVLRYAAKVKIIAVGLVIDVNGTVTYEAEMKGGKELMFDKDGNIMTEP